MLAYITSPFFVLLMPFMMPSSPKAFIVMIYFERAFHTIYGHFLFFFIDVRMSFSFIIIILRLSYFTGNFPPIRHWCWMMSSSSSSSLGLHFLPDALDAIEIIISRQVVDFTLSLQQWFQTLELISSATLPGFPSLPLSSSFFELHAFAFIWRDIFPFIFIRAFWDFFFHHIITYDEKIFRHRDDDFRRDAAFFFFPLYHFSSLSRAATDAARWITAIFRYFHAFHAFAGCCRLLNISDITLCRHRQIVCRRPSSLYADAASIHCRFFDAWMRPFADIGITPRRWIPAPKPCHYTHTMPSHYDIFRMAI